MELSPYVAAVAQDLDRATALADSSTREVVARVAPSLEPAVRLALVQALSDAAAAITADLDEAVVSVRMEGRDPVLDVRVVHDESVAPAPSAEVAEPTDHAEDTARVSLRIPETLKQGAEVRAREAGQSLNTWIVQTVRRAVEPGPTTDPYRRASGRARRVSGWA